MCVDIEIDFSKETITRLGVLCKEKLEPIIGDECSLGLLSEDVDNIDDLQRLLGKCLLNSIMVEALKEQIERDEVSKA